MAEESGASLEGGVPSVENAQEQKPPLLATGNFNERAQGIAPLDKPEWPGGNLLEEVTPGDAVSVIGKQGDWLQIGKDRWINTEYVELNPTIAGDKEGETKPATLARGIFNTHSSNIAPVDKPMWPGGNILGDRVCKPGEPIRVIARQGDWLMIDQDTWISKAYVDLDPHTVSDSWKGFEEWLGRIDRLPPQIPPETSRDVNREQKRIKAYIDSLPPHEKARLESFIETLAPMENNCRIAITIPAYHEEKGIYDTLIEWGNQVDKKGEKLDPRSYEINIVVNREEDKEADETLNEVLRFKEQNPSLRVNVVDMVFPKGEGGVGAARKLITDLTLLRSLKRGDKQEGALYLETEDADLLEIDRRAIYNLITKFDQKPNIDGLRGKQDLAPEVLKEHDFLFFDRRAERFTEYLLRDHRLRPDKNPYASQPWNGVILGGWNCAYTAEAYALIGGYQPVRVGEDVDIGYRISVLRGEKMPSGAVLPNTRAIDTVRNIGQSNPRRFVYSLVTGKHAYHTFGEHEIDEAIRHNDPKTVMQNATEGYRITEDNKKMFEKVLTDTRSMVQDAVKDPLMQQKLFSRLMTVLGFGKYKTLQGIDGEFRISGTLSAKEEDGWKLDYRVDNEGKVHIDNIGNIANALEQYRLKDHASRDDRTIEDFASPYEQDTTPPSNEESQKLVGELFAQLRATYKEQSRFPFLGPNERIMQTEHAISQLLQLGEDEHADSLHSLESQDNPLTMRINPFDILSRNPKLEPLLLRLYAESPRSVHNAFQRVVELWKRQDATWQEKGAAVRAFNKQLFRVVDFDPKAVDKTHGIKEDAKRHYFSLLNYPTVPTDDPELAKAFQLYLKTAITARRVLEENLAKENNSTARWATKAGLVIVQGGLGGAYLREATEAEQGFREDFEKEFDEQLKKNGNGGHS